MSLILDALRKMEQERKARRAGALDIRPEVLSRRAPARPAGANRVLLVGGGLLLLAAGIGTGFLVQRPAPQPLPVTSAPSSAPAPVSVPSPAAPLPVPPPPAVFAPAPVEPAQPLKPSPPAAGQRGGRAAADEPPAIPVEPAPTDLTVSGIAWQEERSLRRAVVNGALVGEGATIAGARVVEIGENRVRFSREGRTFVVTYGGAFGGR